MSRAAQGNAAEVCVSSFGDVVVRAHESPCTNARCYVPYMRAFLYGGYDDLEWVDGGRRQRM